MRRLAEMTGRMTIWAPRTIERFSAAGKSRTALDVAGSSLTAVVQRPRRHGRDTTVRACTKRSLEL